MSDPLRVLLDTVDAIGRFYGKVGFGASLSRLPGGVELPAWLAPTLALASLLSLAVAGGVALASMATLLTSLLLAALILERVFGIAVEVA